MALETPRYLDANLQGINTEHQYCRCNELGEEHPCSSHKCCRIGAEYATSGMI
jgi:hypothetical protein